MRLPHPLAVAGLAAALLVPSAQAELITGTVVDAQGVPQAGVDIDVDNEDSGGDPDVFNDGTAIDGTFNTTVTPGGTYTIVFNPSPPNLITRVPDVNVLGTVNMGIVELLQGVIMTGRCVDDLGQPVAGVNLDVIELASGENLDLIGDTTDAFGQFTIAVPFGELEVRFDATPVTSQTLASRSLEVTATGDFDLGDVVMPDGFRITTVVLGPSGTPVVNADTDTVDTVTGTTLYTPKDNTNGSGFVSVVVPAGIYDFEICPVAATGLVPDLTPDLVVSADVNLGLTSLVAGVLLQGTVRDAGGVPISGVDLDVRDNATQVLVFTCNDNSNGSGQYAVIVPAGVYDLEFEPPYSKPHGSEVVTSVAAGGTTTVNVNLPDCPFHTSYGVGKAGTGGVVPLLTTSGGAPRLGNPDYTLELTNGLGGGTAPTMLGFGPGALPFKGGTILIDLAQPFFLYFLPLSGPTGVAGAGSLSIPAAVPMEPLLIGFSAYAQFFVQDPGATFNLAFSNGVQVTYCD